MFQPFKGTPADARTGHVLQFPYGGRQSFLVEAVRWVTREIGDGTKHLCIEFDGWKAYNDMPLPGLGTRVEAGARHFADRKRAQGAFALRFAADAREELCSPRSLSGRADADQLQTELDDFLTSIGACA